MRGPLPAAVLALAAAFPAPAPAKTAEEAAAVNMQLAAEICLRNYRTPDKVVDAFTAAGFALAPGADPGTHEVTAPELWGVIEPGPEQSYCTFQSSRVPLAMAQAIGTALAERLFPGLVQTGHPERGLATPCDGLSVFAPRQLIWIHYAQAGNSGECIDDGTSAIILNM
ncbi:hypothetical protein R5H32_09130 [Defluviimonas sp. D31]|uniref:hypothetical protein n=1 Tax=Defluviimonas sp. D31 TaxID=3083253 RepID=UPI00296F3AF4|nr:hypothetical protein [Defluviimonas sp. D31]MDW4549512.1 hypothetical protein [Defluviimonas sp. D31]